jgi:hypothetical protein
MIGIRLSQDHERKLCALAREAGMKPSPFARRVLIAFLESQAEDEKDVAVKLSRIEQFMPKLTRSLLRLER